jgi:hypothetical protein
MRRLMCETLTLGTFQISDNTYLYSKGVKRLHC